MLTAEQALPIRRDWLSTSKLSARAEKLLRLGPVLLVLCAKGGAMFGKVTHVLPWRSVEICDAAVGSAL